MVHLQFRAPTRRTEQRTATRPCVNGWGSAAARCPAHALAPPPRRSQLDEPFPSKTEASATLGPLMWATDPPWLTATGANIAAGVEGKDVVGSQGQLMGPP